MIQSAAEFFEQLKASDDFHVERAKLEFALELKRAMERENLSNAQFAERLGVSRPMISKLLRGDANLTIETMVKACRRVKGALFLKIVRDGCSARLFELAQTEKAKPQEHRIPRQTLLEKAFSDVWNDAANDLNIAGQEYEAKSIAA